MNDEIGSIVFDGDIAVRSDLCIAEWVSPWAPLMERVNALLGRDSDHFVSLDEIAGLLDELSAMQGDKGSAGKPSIPGSLGVVINDPNGCRR